MPGAFRLIAGIAGGLAAGRAVEVPVIARARHLAMACLCAAGNIASLVFVFFNVGLRWTDHSAASGRAGFFTVAIFLATGWLEAGRCTVTVAERLGKACALRPSD